MSNELSNLMFYTQPSLNFSGLTTSFEKAKYVIIGVPFDKTSSYRPGSRFAPLFIREASMNIELYSFRSEFDGEKLKIYDCGDLILTGETQEVLIRISKFMDEVLKNNKTPILIGGEHTITYGAVKNLPENSCIISFDAHFDLRDSYLGEKFCHASFMRRIVEEKGAEKVLEVGVRAACNEEVSYVKNNKIFFLSTFDLRKLGVKEAAKTIIDKTSSFNNVYLTLDMDVLDPAFAPGVGNPESDGLDSNFLLSLLIELCNCKIIGFDLVEVNPNYDNGSTAVLAAKIIIEILCALTKLSIDR
ncbi:MAG: agmatinase [Candidatus Bathyarchaeia archaeon]|nr:agmatinase [Candidatus Bathyarchaeota archaeon]